MKENLDQIYKEFEEYIKSDKSSDEIYNTMLIHYENKQKQLKVLERNNKLNILLT